ncbi:origin recognition complex subunit 5 C-terminus-domain-containing protein [Zopfochytrium polystomum]|nr:origin recognition complex subunit 5 C-terminus-domain-containing protein [Zopfochytrium polystomum]
MPDLSSGPNGSDSDSSVSRFCSSISDMMIVDLGDATCHDESAIRHEDGLAAEFPGRESQIRSLSRLLELAPLQAIPAVYIQGLPATGKTTVVKSVLAIHPNVPHGFVDCVQFYTPALLFGEILAAFQAALEEKSAELVSVPRCTSLSEFAAAISGLFRSYERIMRDEVGDGADDNSRAAFCIAVDNADRLRDFGPTFLMAFLALQEQTECNISVILISSLPWARFIGVAGSSIPFIIDFPQYTHSAVKQILALDCPAGEDRSIFITFVGLVQEILQKPCRDLNEIRYIVRLLFPKYVEPIKAGTIKAHEPNKLYRNITVHFKEVLDKLYLRTISSHDWDSASSVPAGRQTVEPLTNSTDIDLPRYTSFLLISSFIASYNPAKMDQRVFALKSDRRRSRAVKKAAPKSKLQQKVLGPRPFTVERLMAIFFAIMTEVEDSAIKCLLDIQMQLATLISRKLVVRITAEDRIDCMKCKCNVNFSFISALARRLHFDLSKFLIDFD